MNNVDFPYLCSAIGGLSGIPVRVFHNDEQIYYYSFVKLPKDPLLPYIKEVLGIESHVGYFITPSFDYYGVVSSNGYKIVIGPSHQSVPSNQEIREQAFEIDVEPDDLDEFMLGIKSIVCMPLASVLQMLCTINYALNGEKTTLEDISIVEEEQKSIKNDLESVDANKNIDEMASFENSAPHNTMFVEQTIANIVRKGDTAALRNWINNAPAVKGGTLAKNQLRQMKNTFIVTVTLISRAAIRGGMDVDEALSLSDSYIQKCELLSNIESIANLQYRMVSDFTERVERLHKATLNSKFVIDVSNYVQKHISEPVDVEALSKAMFLSRSRFSTKFKEETGISPSEFIMKEKIEEAKRLIKYTDKPLSSISDYLGFSSQSHFSRTFRKYAGYSPNEYRLKHNG